jgi:TolB-like protein
VLRKRRGKETAVRIRVLRDGRYQVTSSLEIPAGRGAKIVKPFRGNVSNPVTVQLAVPEGIHTFAVELLPSGEVRLAVEATTVGSFDPARALGSEVDLSPAPADPGPTTATVASVPAQTPEPVAPRAEPAEAVPQAVVGGALAVPVDASVGESTTALADAVANGYSKLGRSAAFHRVAIPYFKELGADVTERHLGQLMAELLAAELSQREPFVLVERERLDQVMREHRLKDLGVVDESTAAQFGRVLGAESLISGTVAEAGANYVVTVRQIDVESGRVLVAGNLEMDREGLVALSSDAVVTRSKGGALFRSALVPGWGQFYNDEPVKAAAFFGTGFAAAGTALGFYLGALEAESLYQRNRERTVPKRELANDYIRIANALLITYGVVWAVNMLDAYLSGNDATTIELSGSAHR